MLIYREAMRLRAEGALLALDATLCGVAPTQSKEGRKAYEALRRDLGRMAGR
jgi:hypothetical protein